MYLQNVQEENVNPEQIIETAEKVLLLLNNHRDLILQEEMPVYQIPIYQMLQVANIRLNHDENALYYARKGEGRPVLLLHQLSASGSDCECSR